MIINYIRPKENKRMYNKTMYDYYSGTFKPSLLRRFLIKSLFNIVYFIFYILYNCCGRKKQNDIALRVICRCIKSIQQKDIFSIRQPFLSIIQPPSSQIDIKNIPHDHIFSVLVNLDKYPTSNTCVFYIHGGGYVSGDVAGFLGMAERISILCGCPVFMPQYRLAPEVLIETSVDDLYAAYHKIGTNFTNIIVMGDSAGGGLSVLLLKKLISQCDPNNIERLKTLVLFSPMLNLGCNSNSHISANDPMFSREIVNYCANTALQGKTPNETNNPIMGLCNNFPPTFISVADDELFYDDAIAFSKKLKEQNIICELYIQTNTVHAFPILWKYSQFADNTFNKMLVFIKKHNIT